MSRRTLGDTLNVTLMGSGDLVQISGYTRESVEFVLDRFVNIDFRVIDQPHESGSMWTACCRRPEVPHDEVQVEKIGHRLFVRSRQRERSLGLETSVACPRDKPDLIGDGLVAIRGFVQDCP